MWGMLLKCLCRCCSLFPLQVHRSWTILHHVPVPRSVAALCFWSFTMQLLCADWKVQRCNCLCGGISFLLSWSDLWLLPPITVTWLSFFCRLFLFIFVIAYLCILIHTLNRKPAQNRCTFTIFCRFNGHVCCCFLSFFLRIMVYKHCVWNCTFSVGLPLICDIQVVQFILTNFA